MLRELTFVLPDGSELVSGGNVYNAELLRALGALREVEGARVPRVRTLRPAEFLAELPHGEPALYLVDSLNLAEAERLAGRAPGQRAVLVAHHLPSLEPGIAPSDPALALERRVLPLFDAWVVTSPFTREVLAARGFPSERLLLVPPELPDVSLGERTYEPPLRALVVANLIRRKGVLELVTELAARMAPDTELTLELVGRDGLEPDYAREVLTALAAPALAGRARFSGPVAYSAMGACYRRANLFVSAASMETFGMALAEAHAHGLPILALDGGHARAHFTPGEDGELFASVPALAARLVLLARDARAMAQLFAAARQGRASHSDSWQLAARRLLGELQRWSR